MSTASIAPVRHDPTTLHRGVLVWELPPDTSVLSSAPVGGGLGRPPRLLNIGVPLDYGRTDLSAHAAEVAAAHGYDEAGTALFTAADIGRVRSADLDGVRCDATVGVSKPTWAADASGGWTPWRAGTINIVVQVPVALSMAAAVNTVVTATEAKTQALLEAGVPGTGTASDAVAVVWARHGDEEPFGGPRSVWGSRVARTVHLAVSAELGAAP